MELWNTGIMLSHRADLSDAFIHNFHRANRWHLASYAMAVEKGFIAPQPQIIPR